MSRLDRHASKGFKFKFEFHIVAAEDLMLENGRVLVTISRGPKEQDSTPATIQDRRATWNETVTLLTTMFKHPRSERFIEKVGHITLKLILEQGKFQNVMTTSFDLSQLCEENRTTESVLRISGKSYGMKTPCLRVTVKSIYMHESAAADADSFSRSSRAGGSSVSTKSLTGSISRAESVHESVAFSHAPPPDDPPAVASELVESMRAPVLVNDSVSVDEDSQPASLPVDAEEFHQTTVQHKPPSSRSSSHGGSHHERTSKVSIEKTDALPVASGPSELNHSITQPEYDNAGSGKGVETASNPSMPSMPDEKASTKSRLGGFFQKSSKSAKPSRTKGAEEPDSQVAYLRERLERAERLNATFVKHLGIEKSPEELQESDIYQLPQLLILQAQLDAAMVEVRETRQKMEKYRRERTTYLDSLVNCKIELVSCRSTMDELGLKSRSSPKS